MKPKIRPLGDVTNDLETVLQEMVGPHKLQLGEILALVNSWVTIHSPDSIEHYIDGKNPVLVYTHPDHVEIK